MSLPWRVLLALVAGLSLAHAAAQADPAARITAAFDRWMAEAGVAAGALVLLKDGAITARVARGRATDAPANLQSLSKAITALCLADLVDDGLARWDMALSDILDTDASVTLAQLVTHTSGLTRDGTQWRMARWRGDPAPRWAEVTARALARDRGRLDGTASAYAYNNENYAVLGVVIEALTGNPYPEACVRRLDLDARLSPLLGGYGPFGGWQMSPEAYARFHHDRLAGRPFGPPFARLPRGAAYGLGTLTRSDETGARTYWHFGLVCFLFGPGDGGSFAASYGTGYTVVAVYDRCVSRADMRALQTAVTTALVKG